MPSQAWGVYFGTVKAPSFYKLREKLRCMVLSRAAKPVFLYAAQAWPPQATLTNSVNALQRRMFANVLRISRYPDKDLSLYCRRRSRVAANVIGGAGEWWAKAWWKRALSWDAHCRRDLSRQLQVFDANCNPADVGSRFAWPPILLDWKGSQFLESVRVVYESRYTGAVSSRTRTRASRGAVCPRWHEGIDLATRMIS